jgi:hypothetical protein
LCMGMDSVDNQRSLGYATDLRSTLLCEDEARLAVSSSASALLPAAWVPTTRPDPATVRAPRTPPRRASYPVCET